MINHNHCWKRHQPKRFWYNDKLIINIFATNWNVIEKVINAPKKESFLNIFTFNWKSIDLSSNKQNADKTLVLK